jgi:hypothetical protein
MTKREEGRRKASMSTINNQFGRRKEVRKNGLFL